MNINQVLKQVLNEISVSKAEEKELRKTADRFLKKISNSVVGGSLAKGTLVKKDVQDVDVFVVFDSEKDTQKLGGILKKAGFSGKKVHGSRDYFQIKHGGVVVEVVPVVRLKRPEDVENVTDFSLSHVSYVKKKLREGQKFLLAKRSEKIPPTHPLRGGIKNSSDLFAYSTTRKLADEIKLAKVFCYANDCYGAESYIQGFSGYALELLVCYFGGFVKFLKGLGKKRVIDIGRCFKNEGEIKRELNEAKLQSPVVLVDPTYKYRNACAGLGEKTFERFLRTAKGFLKKPSADFFEKKEINISGMKKLANKKQAKFFEISLETDRQGGNIAGTKMRKFFNFLIKELERKQQKVLLSEFVYGGEGKKARGYLVVKQKKEIEVHGPPVKDKQAIRQFKVVRKKVYKKGGFVWAKEVVDVVGIFEKVEKMIGEMGLVGFEF